MFFLPYNLVNVSVNVVCPLTVLWNNCTCDSEEDAFTLRRRKVLAEDGVVVNTGVVALVEQFCCGELEEGSVVDSRLAESVGLVGADEDEAKVTVRILRLSGAVDGEAVTPEDPDVLLLLHPQPRVKGDVGLKQNVCEMTNKVNLT